MTKQHAKSMFAAQAKPPAPVGCRAAAIARRLAIVEREIERSDEGAENQRLAAVQLGDVAWIENDRRMRSLFDAEDLLLDEASWARPTSAAGALAAAVLLLHAAREVENYRRDPDEEIAADKWARAVQRLGDQLVAYLSASARVSVEDLGLARLYVDRDIEREVRELAA